MPRWPSSTLLRYDEIDEPVLADAAHRLDARADAGALERACDRSAAAAAGRWSRRRGCARRPAAAAACARPSRPRAAQASQRAWRQRARTPRRESVSPRRCRRWSAAASARSTAATSNTGGKRVAQRLAPLAERRVHHLARSARRRRRRRARRRVAARCAAPPSRRAAPARSRPRARGSTSFGSPYMRTITDSAPYSFVARRRDDAIGHLLLQHDHDARERVPRVSSRRNKIGDAI